MSLVTTGSKCSVKVNGVKVAYIGGIEVDEENALTAIEVLDQLEAAELAETGHSVSASFTMYKIDGNATFQVGLAPQNLSDILTQPEVIIEIYNSVDNRVEYTIQGAKWKGGSGSLDARGVWNGRWSIQGRIGRGM
jgi:hypothetical protein